MEKYQRFNVLRTVLISYKAIFILEGHVKSSDVLVLGYGKSTLYHSQYPEKNDMRIGVVNSFMYRHNV